MKIEKDTYAIINSIGSKIVQNMFCFVKEPCYAIGVAFCFHDRKVIGVVSNPIFFLTLREKTTQKNFNIANEHVQEFSCVWVLANFLEGCFESLRIFCDWKTS